MIFCMSAQQEPVLKLCHNGETDPFSQNPKFATTWGCICTKISLRSPVPGPGLCLVWTAEHVENAVPVHACPVLSMNTTFGFEWKEICLDCSWYLFSSYLHLGNTSWKKECFLSGIARITSPLPLFRATCTSFSAVKDKYIYCIFSCHLTAL